MLPGEIDFLDSPVAFVPVLGVNSAKHVRAMFYRIANSPFVRARSSDSTPGSTDGAFGGCAVGGAA